MQQRRLQPRPRFASPCNVRETVGDIAGRLGVSLSQGDLNQLVHAIGAGGEAGMALALSIAESIAAANYQLTPQLVTSLTDTLNQGANRNLQISHIIHLRLIHARMKRL